MTTNAHADDMRRNSTSLLSPLPCSRMNNHLMTKLNGYMMWAIFLVFLIIVTFLCMATDPRLRASTAVKSAWAKHRSLKKALAKHKAIR